MWGGGAGILWVEAQGWWRGKLFGHLRLTQPAHSKHPPTCCAGAGGHSALFYRPQGTAAGLAWEGCHWVRGCRGVAVAGWLPNWLKIRLPMPVDAC